MHSSPSSPNTGRAPGVRRRYAIAGAVVGAGLIGASVLYPSAPTVAQLKSDVVGVQTPFGRAPLTFADIVDQVKPAVVSVQVTGGSRAGRRWPQSAQPVPRSARGASLQRVLQEPAQGVPQQSRRPGHDAASRAGAGLRFRHLSRRLRGHQQSRRRRGLQGSGQLRRAEQVRCRRGRHRPAHRPGPAQDQGVQVVSVREVRRQAGPCRRLGGRGRQPVRPRRHRHGRHRLCLQPRHRLGPLRLHPDRRGGEPRQLRRPDLQPRRRGRRRQHRHLQPVRRQRRHCVRRAGEDGQAR